MKKRLLTLVTLLFVSSCGTTINSEIKSETKSEIKSEIKSQETKSDNDFDKSNLQETIFFDVDNIYLNENEIYHLEMMKNKDTIPSGLS